MCGIAGCLALALDADPDQAWLTRALDRISHRGPDDDGVYTDKDVALGFRRLSILDLSLAGHQPMRSADGRFWMSFNGEIYNYVELGAELREQGVTLRSTGDAAVLLETYALVGKDVVHRLRGMYAFAIWDTWTRELFCARDPFGIKPFFYCIDQRPGTVAPGQAAGAGEGAACRPASQPSRGGLNRGRPTVTAASMTGSPLPRSRPGGPAGMRPESLMIRALCIETARPGPRPRQLPRVSRRRAECPAPWTTGSVLPPSARRSRTRGSCGTWTLTRCAGTCPSSTCRRRPR